MQALIDEVLEASIQQAGRLGETRDQLQTVRRELVATIADANEQKAGLRVALNVIER